MDVNEIKKRISTTQKLLDLFRKMLGLMTSIEKVKMEIKIREICEQEGLNKASTDLIVAVIKCESGLNPKVVRRNRDGSYDVGICQYNSKWYIGTGRITWDEALHDVNKSVRLMIERYKKGKLKDWVCYSTGRYVSFL